MLEERHSECTLVDVLRQQASRYPHKRAFTVLDRGEIESQHTTYSELDERARSIAAALRDFQLQGERIILAYPSGTEFIAALFGCFYAGATAVPAPIATHGRSHERIGAIAADADAAAILSCDEHIRVLHSLSPQEQNHRLSIPMFATDHWTGTGQDTKANDVHGDSLAIVQYTSGSTGTPRGVMLTHANLLNNQRVLARALQLTSEVVAVYWVPLHHDMGLIGGVLHSIYTGGCSVLMAPLSFLQRPVRWLQAIDRYAATLTMAPSFAYQLCAERVADADVAKLDLSQWQVAICGGETIRPRSLARFAERFRSTGFNLRAFLPAYGLAEATLMATCVPRGSGLITHTENRTCAEDCAAGVSTRACCGQPWCGEEVAIVNPATLQRVPDGGVGEIWFRGKSVAAGYWNRGEETQSVFGAQLADDSAPHAWLRTGDLGYLCPDGLVIKGRAKETLVVRGVNIYPQDLEMTAQHCDSGLGVGAAFSVETHDGEVVILVQEVRRDALRRIDVYAVIGKVSTAINRSFGLTLYDLVLLRPGSLFRTTSGKIQRFACRRAYFAGSLPQLPSVHHPALARCRPGSVQLRG